MVIRVGLPNKLLKNTQNNLKLWYGLVIILSFEHSIFVTFQKIMQVSSFLLFYEQGSYFSNLFIHI